MAEMNKIILNGTQYDFPSGGSTYTAGDNIDITNNVISVDIDDEKKVIASALVELHNDKADKNQLNNYQLKGDYTTAAQVDTKIAAAVTNYRTEAEAISVENVDAAALTDLNSRVETLEQGGGGGGITGITMNGSAVTVTSGVANLGTVVTDKSDKQDTLVSGTNIKTINNESLLGSGNITIGGGGGTQVQSDWSQSDTTAVDYIKNKPTNVSAFTNDAGYTTNTGTITGITMNGASKGTSGVVDLGTVITDKSDKQDTLVSGTNIKTINNESILGSGNITISGGGGSYAAGTNISIDSSGGTDTINCTLPITAGTHSTEKGIIVGDNECSSTGMYSVSIGHNADNGGQYSICMGSNTTNGNSGQMSLVVGTAYNNAPYNLIVGSFSTFGTAQFNKRHNCVIGDHLISNNDYQASFGTYNDSTYTSATFGNSGNTLFSVGNGYDYQSTHNRHNAFELRQNGDVYIADTDDETDTSATGYSTKPMLRLQDYIAIIRSLVNRVTALETALGTINQQLAAI